jgi:HK97 family phage major capsid protein
MNSNSESSVITRDEQKKYSLARYIRGMLPGSYESATLENEIGQRMSGRGDGVKLSRPVPMEIVSPALATRDLSVGNFGSGGALVETSVSDEIVPLLRNVPLCRRLGARILTGLSSNVSLPRQTSPSTASNMPETGTVQTSTPSVDQLILTPHRVSVSVVFSRQLILQSSADVEAFIRDDISRQINLAIDSAVISGAGAADQPLGILNTPGVGSVLFAGTATWSSIVAFETQLASQNVSDDGSIGYLMTPTVKGRLKTVAKTGVGVTSVVPIFLWEGDAADEYGDGEMNGYTAMSTNQVPANAMIFGNFEELIHAMWGGYDVIVDPYTEATAATVRVVVNTFGDVAVRHPVSFCVSADAANQ